MRHGLIFALAIACAAAPLAAQPTRHVPAAASAALATPAATPAPAREPIYAPPPAWVEPVEPAQADPARRDRSMQLLLSNAQSFYAADHIDHYIRIAFLMQDAQALQSIGNITLTWNPDQSALIINHARILRGGQVIDLLANGQRFTVLRRENGLESAMLDGTLTATFQAEGLAIGDVLDVAWTVTRRGGTLPIRGENLFAFAPLVPAGRLSIRQTWAPGVPIHWRGTGSFEHPQLSQTPRGTRLAIDLQDVVLPTPPGEVPPSALFASTLQLSQYRDWAEVSAMLAPYYQHAAELAPNSPLRAEIARIAAASPDPRVRAMQALRLVQDQVRYFALLMGDGNYLPATADQSWSRRYADCKGKSVLLMALLQGLGIEAEPVVVSTTLGEVLHDRLPLLSSFNHVIVRARIDGRSYWLDGTRTGDRVIDDLAVSGLGWGLPLTTAGAPLEQLPFGPPSRALFDATVTVDASHGVHGALPVRAEMTMRGDAAATMRMVSAQIGREEMLRQMHSNVTAPLGLTATNYDFRDDPEAGTFTFMLTGTLVLPWAPVPGTAPAGGPRRLAMDIGPLNAHFEATRPDGPYHDTPVTLSAPVYEALTETILLPDGGRGFTLEGADFDRIVAGTRFRRSAALGGGRLVVRSEIQRVTHEISAEAVRNSDRDLRPIRDDRAWLHAVPAVMRIGTAQSAPPPITVPITRATVAQEAQSRPSPEAGNPSAEALALAEGAYRKLDAGDLTGAEADFTRAARLAPGWAKAQAGRGYALLRQGRLDDADAALASAEAINPDEPMILQVRGMLQIRRGSPLHAVEAFGRALALAPNDDLSRMSRASTKDALGAFDEAQADLQAILTRDPRHQGALTATARLNAWRGAQAPAIAAADRLLATDPTNPGLIRFRANLFRQFGRDDEAAAGYRAALAAVDAERPTATGPAADTLGLQRRAIMEDMNDTAGAVADISAALALHPNDAQLLNARCWARATHNVELNEALADCNAALTTAPHDAHILDSRAFVRLRLGQLDGAIADENEALARTPDLPAALYTRGIAYLRKGDRAAGERDLAAARRASFDIESSYRVFGIMP